MQRFLLLSLLTIFLSACAAPATMTQTSEVFETSEVSAVTATSEITVMPSETATAIPAPELAPNVIPDWEMGCLKDDMCMGLEVADGHKNYMMMAEAFVASYENRAWLASMGIKDIDGFMKFLENSKHTDPITGNERIGWIPLVAKDGKSTFKILQGNGSAANGIFSDKNPTIVKAGGFFFDNIGFVAASKAEIDANVGGVADLLQKMRVQNGRDFLIRTSSVRIEEWGLGVLDGQLVFMGINNASLPTGFPQGDRLLGQPDPEKNARIMSAYWKLYTDVYGKFANSRHGGSLVNSYLDLEPDSDK